METRRKKQTQRQTNVLDKTSVGCLIAVRNNPSLTAYQVTNLATLVQTNGLCCDSDLDAYVFTHSYVIEIDVVSVVTRLIRRKHLVSTALTRSINSDVDILGSQLMSILRGRNSSADNKQRYE